MFIERTQAPREEPIYGRKAFGFAPKGASRSQFGLVFYKHFAATRFLPQPPEVRRLKIESSLTHPGVNAWARETVSYRKNPKPESDFPALPNAQRWRFPARSGKPNKDLFEKPECASLPGSDRAHQHRARSSFVRRRVPTRCAPRA